MEFELDDRLRALIKCAAITDGINECSIETEPGSAKGDNYLGIITKVRVTDADSDKSMDLIMKTASSNPDFRKVVPIAHAFRRESYMYNHVLAAYNALLQEHNLEPLKAFPQLLAADMRMPEALIMDDMKAQGYVMCNRTEFLDLPHVKLVMTAYGRLHGLYYALQALNPAKSGELRDGLHEAFFSQMDLEQSGAANPVGRFNERAMKALLPDDVKARERFEEYANATMKKVLQALRPTAAGRFAVINHGDSWVNNMLFSYRSEEAQEPSQVCLLDFQFARIGSPALDLSYFIFTCTDQKLREKHFDEIMTVYHSAMRDLLHDFSLNVDDFLTYAELHQQMRLFSIFGIYMSIMVTHLMLSDQEEVPDYQNMKIKDDNLDDTMRTFAYVSKNESRYMERIRGVILDAADKDYI